MRRLLQALYGRSILLGLSFAMFAISAIGIVGITLSVMVAETVQGSGSAINVAGSLRKQSHLMGSLVVSDAENRVSHHGRLRVAMDQFEASLNNPKLTSALQRDPDGAAMHAYRSVQEIWLGRLKPQLTDETTPGIDDHPPERHNQLLAGIDDFVAEINAMVAQLEEDTERRIRQLRQILGAALVLTILVALGVIFLLHRDVLRPLSDLVDSASRLARGEFTARVRHVGGNELGQVGESFNFMAEELSKLYQGLEQRVAEKTLELTRSNQSLELLYHCISRLHHAPAAADTYQDILTELDRVLDLAGSMACALPKHGGPAVVLGSTLAQCEARAEGRCPCHDHCPEPQPPWVYHPAGQHDCVLVPLRDAEGQYGVLRLELAAGRRLEAWREQLLEALSRHIGVALGTSHKAEQERLLALQEERSVIARELHDSLAQALSYMKIQASLMQPVLSDPQRRQEAETILRDLREGITSAYRELRELLATFRLKMEGDFLDLLGKTVSEYAQRSGMPIHLDTRLAGLRLTPNQEIHILQIIREALSNMARHAHAQQAWVSLHHADDGMVTVSVEDDGIGLARPEVALSGHYGMTIMRERARGLNGEIAVTSRPNGGTIVSLGFRTTAPHHGAPPLEPSPLNAIPTDTPTMDTTP